MRLPSAAVVLLVAVLVALASTAPGEALASAPRGPGHKAATGHAKHKRARSHKRVKRVRHDKRKKAASGATATPKTRPSSPATGSTGSPDSAAAPASPARSSSPTTSTVTGGGGASGAASPTVARPRVARRTDGRIPVGFNDDWPLVQAWSNPALADARAALDATTQAALGSTVTRLPLYWNGAQPAAGGPINWRPWDQIVNAYAAAGIKPVLNISAAPFWARDLPDGDCGGPCANAPPTDDHLVDFRRFVAAVAQHYGTRVAGIEIYNEPNHADYWQQNPVDPARYTRVLCAGYAGVQDAGAATGTRLPVGGGSLAIGQYNENGSMSLTDFLHAMMVAGAASCMDAIGFHPYPLGTDLSPGGLFQRAFAQVRAQRDAYAPGMPLWVSETGLATSGASESTQATTLTGIYQTIAAMPQHDVDLVDYHTLVGPDFGITSAGLTGDGALVLAPRPAYTALLSLLAVGR